MNSNKHYQTTRNLTDQEKADGLPVGPLVKWLADLQQVYFPDYGPEWWSDNRWDSPSHYLRPADVLPSALDVREIACYVVKGGESPLVKINVVLKSGEMKNITCMKIFAPEAVCWEMCSLFGEALEDYIRYQEEPIVVDMFRAIPKKHSWSTEAKVAGPLTFESMPQSYRVLQQDGTVLWSRNLDVRVPEAVPFVLAAHFHDWKRVFDAVKVEYLVSTNAAPAIAA